MIQPCALDEAVKGSGKYRGSLRYILLLGIRVWKFDRTRKTAGPSETWPKWRKTSSRELTMRSTGIRIWIRGFTVTHDRNEDRTPNACWQLRKVLTTNIVNEQNINNRVFVLKFQRTESSPSRKYVVSVWIVLFLVIYLSLTTGISHSESMFEEFALISYKNAFYYLLKYRNRLSVTVIRKNNPG